MATLQRHLSLAAEVSPPQGFKTTLRVPAGISQAPSRHPPREEWPERETWWVEPSAWAAPAAVPSVEWTYHRTADGQHPNGNEQQLMWLMNRARQNPTTEGIWLATTQESGIARGRDYFVIDTQLLQSQFASYAPKPSTAFDARLYSAAKVHSEDLIVRDAQDHLNQFQRITDAGFNRASARGNVFSYATSALNAYGAFKLPGDVNGNGAVNALNVVAVINAVLGIQPLPAADVNGDGAVNALDVVFVINRVLGVN